LIVRKIAFLHLLSYSENLTRQGLIVRVSLRSESLEVIQSLDLLLLLSSCGLLGLPLLRDWRMSMKVGGCLMCLHIDDDSFLALVPGVVLRGSLLLWVESLIDWRLNS
jgi:hypothetical protein